MGTTAHLITVGSRPEVVDHLVARLVELERRWTRFSDESELARLNRAAGALTVVEPDTYRLIASAVEGWHRTKGCYDPTVLQSMNAIGYDRSFRNITTRAAASPLPAPGCSDIVLIADSHAVQLPRGVQLDFGGIGKGFAADLLCEETIGNSAATGVCVNIGGDMRAIGEAPTNDGWIVELPATSSETTPALRVAVADGAVCTSRTDLRSWTGPDSKRHHLLDPRTGMPTETDMTAISVVAGSAVVAELVTKATIVGGVEAAAEHVAEFGAAAVAVTSTGSIVKFGNLKDFLT